MQEFKHTISFRVTAEQADWLLKTGDVSNTLRRMIANEMRGGWRDMESAPTDGSDFLADTGGGNVDRIYMGSGSMEGKWCWTDGYSEFVVTPISWMPLPTPRRSMQTETYTSPTMGGMLESIRAAAEEAKK